MKYVILKDLKSLKNKKKIYFSYILCLILFCLFNEYISKQIEVNNMEIKTLGMLFSNNFLDILIYVLNMAIYIYVSILIFLSDIQYGGQNIFLRFTKRKYFLLKLFSLAVIMMALKIISHIIVHMFYSSSFDFYILLIDFFYTFIISLLVIVFYIISILNKKLFCVLISVLVILVFLNLYLLSSINLSLICLIIVNLFLISLYMYLNKFLFDVYERND